MINRPNSEVITLISLVGIGTGLLSGEPLVTDRPDATESSSVIAPRFTQYEVGMTTFKDAAGASGTQYGSSLLRFGFAENWELRIGWDGYLDSEGASGEGDGLLGIKYYLMPEAKGGFQPEMALLVHTSLPIGSDDWTSDKLDPNFLFAFSHTLSEKLSLGYNLGAKLETSENENGGDSTLASGLYSVALGYGVSDRLGFFVEVFGEAGFSSDDAPATFNGGVTWLFNDDSQLDLFAGVGLNEDADDWFAGVGYSVRWGW